jgi:hypothetical protein
MPPPRRAARAGTRRRRRAHLLLALFAVLALAATRGVSAQTTDGDGASTDDATMTDATGVDAGTTDATGGDTGTTDDTATPTTTDQSSVDPPSGASEGEEDADIPPPVEKVEVAKYFTEFTRQGPYPYQICAELPGEIGDPDTILTARSARCIPVEAGELEFCAGVSYDVCSRVVSPTAYDEELQAAHDERVARYTMEWPSLATSECFAAFKLYVCLLSFPRCEEDSQNPGTYFEIPLCYDYCVNAHATCGSPAEKSQAACDVAVARGRVAPPRKDVTCVSRGFRVFANGAMRVAVGIVLAQTTVRRFGGARESL